MLQSILKETKSRTQGRNLEVENEAETMEECTYWFIFHGLLNFYFYANQGNLTRNGIVHSGDGLSHINY